MKRKKYEFTGETLELSSMETLHRIRAIIDIPNAGVNAGDIGGWIKSDSNLSHSGDAWVSGDAKVSDHAWVSGNALICENGRVSNNAWVGGNARVSNNACVCGDARIWNNAYVFDDARVYDCASVYGDARVGGSSVIGGDASVSDNAQICGRMVVLGETQIGGNAHIKSNKDFITIGPIGSRNGFVTFHKSESEDIYVECGCFSGTMDEFLAAVDKTHGNNRFGREYRFAAELAKTHILEEDNHD